MRESKELPPRATILPHIFEAAATSSYTDEQAQDAVGAMVDSTLVYTDSTPLLSRAALTGDVTASAGSNTTTIANGAVTLAKQANVASASVFYRKTAGTGAPEVQTLATLKTDLGLTGTNTGDQTISLTGDVTGSGTGSFSATIANDAVTFAKMQNVTGPVLLGRTAASSGDIETITMQGSSRLSAAILALSPTAYWRVNDTSGNFLDSAGGGYTATLTGSVTRAVSALLPDASTRYARFTAASGAYGVTSSALGQSRPLNGSWSVIALIRPLQVSGTATTRYVFHFGASGETEATNDQCLIYIASTVRAFWEFSAGTNVEVVGPSILPGQTYLLHVVKNSSASSVTFYINGMFAGSGTYANEPTGGSSATVNILGSTSGESDMIGGEVAFFNGTAHTQTQVETVAIAAGLMGV